MSRKTKSGFSDWIIFSPDSLSVEVGATESIEALIAKHSTSELARAISLLDDDQNAAITRLYECNHTLLIAGMGSGKTVIACTAAKELLEVRHLRRVLVLAPAKVAARTWTECQQEWAHLQGLDMRACVGTPKARAAVIESDCKVVVLSYDNLPWLVKQYPGLYERGFDGLIADEVTRLSSTGALGFRRFRSKIQQFKWRVGMSGTPVTEDLANLFGQMLIVDGGQRLGRNKQRYLDRYFVPQDYERRTWAPRPGAVAEVAAIVGDAVWVMPDYRHTLPDLVVEPVMVDLSPAVMEKYRAFARDELMDDVTPANAAVMQEKLRQFASGFVYTDVEHETGVIDMHGAKWDAAGVILDRSSEPTLVLYEWKRQQRALAAMHVPALDSDARIDEWCRGDLRAVMAHPRSVGHGLNLQGGGAHELWMSPPWSRDQWEQTVARLWRRGQRLPVLVEVLIARGTVDELVWRRCLGKGEFEAEFRAHLQALQS